MQGWCKIDEILERKTGCFGNGIHGVRVTVEINHRASILPIINQIKELTEGCHHFVICHVQREANEAAHKLAKFASCYNPERAWNSQVADIILRCNEQDYITVMN